MVNDSVPAGWLVLQSPEGSVTVVQVSEVLGLRLDVCQNPECEFSTHYIMWTRANAGDHCHLQKEDFYRLAEAMGFDRELFAGAERAGARNVGSVGQRSRHSHSGR